LATVRPDLVKEWHPTKNGELTPWDVTAGSGKKVWWKCAVADDHEWEAEVVSRTQGCGCPSCANLKAVSSNCLATTHPDLAKQWHPTKNGTLTPNNVVAASPRKVWWKCPVADDHEWQASIASRSRLGVGCSCCAKRTVVKSNCLATTHPDLAKEWHPIKNGDLTASDVTAGTERKIWWKCAKGPDHEWQARIDHRARVSSGCPRCNAGWTLQSIRAFVECLKDHLQTFTPAELYLLFQQNGLLRMYGKGKGFVKALSTGRFPREEIEKFVNGQPSLVDEFVQDPTQTLENLDSSEAKSGTENDLLDRADEVVAEVDAAEQQQLPLIETKKVLASLGHHVITSADEDAVEFLLASAVAKIWKHAYQDEATALAQAETFQGEAYAEQVRTRFLNEYQAAKDLAIPASYAFQVEGKPTAPNLMQRHFAVRVRERERVGNWSGTGSGKTLAAVLATRVVGSKLTVVCCPNSVVEGWRNEILGIFPDSVIATKTFEPEWSNENQAVAAGFSLRRDRTLKGAATGQQHRYLILNYEAFQQPDSAQRVRGLVERERIDFVIVDEIHYAKQRAVENISQRRQMVAALTSLAAERNPNVHVLGMSATPVINNLQEGKSMVELVTGLAHHDLDTRPTVPNCMKLHQRLLTLGIRWMPDYKKMLGYECREERVEVDCCVLVEEIRALGNKITPLALEKILTRVRLPVIRQHVRPKTLIYTYYIEGIDRLLREALIEDGWKVGFYTGDDKTGKDAFINGDLDVLIATAAIGTGVDGLQHVCNRLIVNVLPWTRAEYDQLLGRIYRQGQVSKEEVSVIIPLTYAMVNGQRWSWCESKMQRLAFKKSIADAAVDGVVPEGHLRSPAQALQDVMAWLERLDAGKVEVITRPRIVVPLPDTDPADVQRRRARYGDFSAMNRTWNHTKSEATHKRLGENPEEWAQYHTLYREARKDWAVVPYEEMVRWCQKRSGYVIGDFGCGEAKLAEALSDRHTLHSFDHVAINDNVVACDMAHVPLDDETLDMAVFSLSLMGANFADYLREAWRTLKLDGDLHVIEATSRFTNRDGFVEGLRKLGFAVVSVEDKWKFTHIRALKTDSRPSEDVDLRF
jgi:superfamily II DNA or RNA helicase